MMRRNYTKLQLSSLGFSPSSFSHFLQVVPLQSLCTSTCCWRSREISPGRTHRRERSARTPKFHMPFSRQPAHVSWSLSLKAPSTQKAGENTPSCCTHRKVLLHQWLIGFRKKKTPYLWTFFAVLQGSTLHHPSPTAHPQSSMQQWANKSPGSQDDT